MSSPSFYSRAGNFISAIQGGVDPRTGLFNVSLPLINLHTSDLAGPGLSLALRYSPLSSIDDGFGRGFALNLTRYDTRSRQLLLSTGEEYRISSSGDAVRQKKSGNFIFEKTNNYTYRVIHKSGLVETLSQFGPVAYTTGITDACGRQLHLSWNWSDTMARLSEVFEVEDAKRTILCKVACADARVATTTFTVLPGSAESGYDIVFSFGSGALLSVTSRADTPERVWTFTYDRLNPYVTKWQPGFLTGMTSPTGLKEEVVYPYSEGMAFPDGVGLAPLPRVTLHRLLPGGGQPAVTTQWEWTEENYLGRNLPGRNFSQWQSDTDLMLSGLHFGYVYGSTAKILDASQRRVLCAVTRRYNSFHLQVSESTLRDGKTHSVATEYHARPGATFGEQPDQYLLPVKQTETWNDVRTRTRITRWQFGAAGNPLRQEVPDGVVTEYVWYPAQGEGDACPPDPHGFTRYLKRKTVTPRRVKGDEPATVAVHTWKKQSDRWGESYAVVGDTVTETTGGVKTVVTRTYYADLNDALTSGREKTRTTTLTPDVQAGASYTSRQSFAYKKTEQGLSQAETLTTHDGLTVTRQTLRHAGLGLLLSETDAQGVTVTHSYDKTGRVLSRKLAPGTHYENISTWSYAIEDTGPVTTETDVAGNGMKIFFDGAGREIRRQRFDKDGTQAWFDVLARTYNPAGETVSGTGSDWLTGSREQYLIRTGFTYDGWGSIRDQDSSDGVVVRRTTDPLALTQTVFAKGSVGGENLDTPTLLTALDERSLMPRFRASRTQGVNYWVSVISAGMAWGACGR